MKIILTNCIKIENPTKEVKDFVKKELIFKNPQYDKMKRMGFYAYGTPREIKLYDEYNGDIYTPIGFFNRLYQFHPINNDYVDYSVEVPVHIESSIQLRKYQELAVPSVLAYKTGILNLPVGLGKTELALECVNRTQQKTLWITHTGDLLDQSYERCNSKMKCKTSKITNGKMDTSGDIVFCTVQSLIKFVENRTIPQDMFGMIIVDECHHISANPGSIQMFRTCVDYFASRYKIGLSATVHRADGLEKCIEYILGGIIYKIEKQDNEYVCIYEDKELYKFPIDDFQVPAHIKAITTKYSPLDRPVYDKNGGTIQYASLISDIAMDKDRNKIILDILRNVKGSAIVLSDRVEQLKFLCSMVPDGIEIDGNTPKKERKQALEDVGSGKIRILFASYNLAKEGLSVNRLSNLIMGTPVKDFAIVSQSIGRIQRPFEGKISARVYDLVDDCGYLRNMYAKRRAVYRKNNWAIDNIYADNKEY